MTEYFLEIIASTFAGMILGALWYSPILFGNAWMKALDKTPETLGSATVPMIGSVIASVLTAIGVSILFAMLNVVTVTAALGIGALLGLLIIFPAFMSDNLFCGWGTDLLLIQSGYRIVTLLLMSLITFFV